MSNLAPIYEIKKSVGPLVFTAIHDGHDVRPDLRDHYRLTSDQRLREEDPFTGIFADQGHHQIIGLSSRFEVDLNRPRERAVYQKPEDAWGLQVWKNPLSSSLVNASLERYDDFYAGVKSFLDQLVAKHGCFVMYDIHSYNHRREGPDAAPDDPDKNPEVNIGTGNVNRQIWGPLIDQFIAQLRQVQFDGKSLDVRENVKFKGGYFSKWIQEQYGGRSCVIAVEFKKIFMDEWSGQPNYDTIELLKKGLANTIPVVLEQYHNICSQIK